MTSVEQATALLGGEKTPTMHTVDVILAGIVKEQTDHISTLQPGSVAHTLATSLRASIIERRDKLFKECETAALYVQVATLLTPVYSQMIHLEFLPNYVLSNEDALWRLFLAVRALDTRFSPSLLSSANRKVGMSTASDKLHPLLLAAVSTRCSQNNNTENSQPMISLKEEFKIYEVISMEYTHLCPLEFWKLNSVRFPMLSSIASVVFTPPATSVPSERIFSPAGWLRETRRSRLTPENAELLVKVGHFLRLHDTPVSFGL